MNNDNIVLIFNEIYDEYYKKIVRYFHKDFGIEDSEDLAQQVFMQLWAWLPNSYAIKNRRALVYKIAKNIKTDKFRKNSLMLEALLPEEFDAPDGNSLIDIVDIKLVISKLSKSEQQLLLLSLKGYNSFEIAKELDASSSTVRTRLQKIRKKLYELCSN